MKYMKILFFSLTTVYSLSVLEGRHFSTKNNQAILSYNVYNIGRISGFGTNEIAYRLKYGFNWAV